MAATPDMDTTVPKKCEACEGTAGLFRPVRKGKSERCLWACSAKCARILERALAAAFVECKACDGEGTWTCENPFCPDALHECEKCAGEGLVERRSALTGGPDDPVLH